ncbi:MAG TPA: hypothetical protein VNN79_09600 [Actinomycetota bacterium]|nr:hypothetical protein [Actinomycetota bacterium]
MSGALASKYVWLVTGEWRRLHYVPAVDDRDDHISGLAFWETYWDGRHVPMAAICGTKAEWQLPGILSRIGLDRCARCCDILGIERGHGAPMNERWEKAHA